MKINKLKVFFGAGLLSLVITSCGSLGTKYHTVTFDTGGGTVIEPAKIEHGEKVDKPADPVREGYTFVNWTYNDEEWSFVGYVVTEDITITANWSANTYTLTLVNSNVKFGEISESGKYKYDSDVTIKATPKVGYAFSGWFDKKGELVSSEEKYSFKMGLSQTLTAKWENRVYKLTVSSEDDSKGTAAIISGTGEYNNRVTIEATPKEGYAFKGWYNSSSLVNTDSRYSFIMPASNCALQARFYTEAEAEAEREKQALGISPKYDFTHRTVTYGLYPQKNINDPDLNATLEQITTKQPNGWYLYENSYYAKIPYAAYRVNGTSKFDNGTTIESDTPYWFKCEPIQWQIVAETDDTYYLLSSVLIDAHRYDDDNGSYYNSEIRSWLNNEFYKSAFSLGNSLIQTTHVDNSPASNYNSNNSCSDTYDKVFLPSFMDYYKNLDNYAFYCLTTDWARANGASYSTATETEYCGTYWTRSPGSKFDHSAWFVSSGGYIGDGTPDQGGLVIIVGKLVDSPSICARPAITISK